MAGRDDDEDDDNVIVKDSNGTLLADGDSVDLTNLQRQILHATASVGKLKAESGRETLARLISQHQASSELLLWLAKERSDTFADILTPEVFRAMVSAIERDIFNEKKSNKLRDYILADQELLEHQFLAGAAPVVDSWVAQTALVYGVMASGFAISWAVFRLLQPRLRDDARLYRAVALAAFSAYYLGVTPEIREAWSMPAWAVPVMLSLPALAVVGAMRGQRTSRALPVIG